MSKAYKGNLTQEQFELIKGLIRAAKPSGRKREVDIWEILNAIFYILCEDYRWRALPGDFPNWQTVYTKSP
jgi:transposase